MKYLKLLLPLLFASVTSSAQLVVHIIDGDTYKVVENGKIKTIRLANVDAPELNQYFGKLIKAYVAKLILARIVKIDKRRVDRYGRIVADVTIDGMSLDSLLVSKGWAWHYVSCSLNPELSIYQQQAINSGKGMWRCKHNIPPWIWRKLNKKQKRLKEMCR